MGPLQGKLVVAGHNDFVAMGQLSEPLIKVGDGVHAAREHREVTAMYQDVCVWNVDLAMEFMRVAEKREAHCALGRPGTIEA